MSGRTRLSRLARAVLLVAGLAAVSGCVTAKPDASRESIADSLQDAGLSAEEAGCVADAIFERFGEDSGTLTDIRDAQDAEDLSPEVREAVDEAVDGCISG